MKTRVPLTFAFLAGIIPIVAFFLNGGPIKEGSDILEKWMIIIYGFALPLGVVNVTQVNIKKIQKGGSGAFYATTLLVSLYAMGLIGLLGAFDVGPFQGIGFRPDGSRTPFQWVSDVFYNPLQATMFALLAFYVASAAFRAFRVRNVEATLLLTAAVIVMLGRIPFGETLFAWTGHRDWLPRFTEWIMSTPNAAAQRGIIIGAALGAASMSIRVILGIERSYMGMEREK
jgi:hypothetical protein